MVYNKNKPRRKLYNKKYKKRSKYPLGRRLVNNYGKSTDNGMPESLFCKLKYVSRLTLSGAPSSYFFGGNNIFTCDISGLTGQPYNADQLCSLYSRWTVTSSKIKIRAQNNTQGGTLLVRPTLTTATIGDFSLECMRPDSKCVDVVTRGKATLNHFESSKNVFGLPSITNDVAYDGSANASGPNGAPSVQWYWVITSIGSDGLTTDMDLQVEIEYYVKCNRRSIQGTST